MSKIISRTGTLFATLTLAGLLPLGCGGSESSVNSSSASIDRSVRALTGPGGAQLSPKSIKGTFGAGCKVKTSDGKWELKLNDGTSTLQVALNDTFSNCPLTMTAVSVQVGSQLPAVDYTVSPPIVLNNGYAMAPSAVNGTGGALAFYTNAKFEMLSGSVYANNFKINMLYSDDALACGAVAPPAIYAKVTATATGASVPPPNYLISFDSLQLVVDANKVVQPSSGNVVLSLPQMGAQPGEQWKVFDESTMCCSSYSFAEIDNLYKNATAVASGSFTGTNSLNIPWSSFDLLGKTLPKSRTVVVKHTDGGGVYSYELFQILFPGPN
ncbi:MAG: hypothetical protein U1A78_16110 [Polyangia bacterium]